MVSGYNNTSNAASSRIMGNANSGYRPNNSGGDGNNNQSKDPSWMSSYRKYADVLKELKAQLPNARFDSEIYLLDLERDIVIFRATVLDEHGAVIARQSAKGNLTKKDTFEKAESKAMRRAILVALGYSEGGEDDEDDDEDIPEQRAEYRGGSTTKTSTNNVRTTSAANTKTTVAASAPSKQPVPFPQVGVAVTPANANSEAGNDIPPRQPTSEQHSMLQQAALAIAGRTSREEGSIAPEGLIALDQTAFQARLLQTTNGLTTDTLAALMGYASLSKALGATKDVLGANGYELAHYSNGQKLALLLTLVAEWVKQNPKLVRDAAVTNSARKVATN